MQPSLVLKQGNPGQVNVQGGIVTVPMSVNSSMPAGVMTINKPVGQSVVATSQNINASQPTIIPNVQILNMRLGAPGVAAQKSVATVSPRVVIGSPQVVGTRAPTPGITLQSLQAGQQGHLLLKTENGQYQLLRVGPAPSPLRLANASTANAVPSPAPSAQVAVSTSSQLQHITPQQPTAAPATTVSQTKPSDSTKEKCRNFLSNLLELSSKEPKSVEVNVRSLIQELIDSQVEPEQFCDRLERLLNASPQPCLIGFLKKSLPLLRQSMINKELVIDGINPPQMGQSMGGNMPLQKLPAQKVCLGVKSNPSAITILDSTPVTNIAKLNKYSNKVRSSTPTVVNTLIPGRSLIKEREKKPVGGFLHPFDDKLTGDNDDINDVAAMGGVNLAEETQRILGSTDMIGTQIRSCKDEVLVSTAAIQYRMRMALGRHCVEESPGVSLLLAHALQDRLKTIIEKLAVIATHRPPPKMDSRYEVTQDVKGQLKFLEELDRLEKKRTEDSEREILLRAAKSRSKNEDPEQAKLKAKAKEMQRVELEELRQREANLTALQAIGPRKKPRLDLPDTNISNTGQNMIAGRGQSALRSRLQRITVRDVLFLLEQEPDTAKSSMLYKAYLRTRSD